MQFGFLGNKIISNTAGAFFIQKSAENDPFIAKYYLSQCPYVGPYYSPYFDQNNKRWLFFDWVHYDHKALGDQEFGDLFMSRNPAQLPPIQIPFEKHIQVQAINV